MSTDSGRPDPTTREDWRGTRWDAGRHLQADDHRAAATAYLRDRATHDQIDAAVRRVVGSLDHSHAGGQRGAEHSLKEWESFRRNVARDRQDGVTIADAVQQRDLHSYTHTFSPATFQQGVEDFYEQLENGGFVRHSGTSFWDFGPYKRTNTVWWHTETRQFVEFCGSRRCGRSTGTTAASGGATTGSRGAGERNGRAGQMS